jgi:hypothetical protein
MCTQQCYALDMSAKQTVWTIVSVTSHTARESFWNILNKMYLLLLYTMIYVIFIALSNVHKSSCIFHKEHAISASIRHGYTSGLCTDAGSNQTPSNLLVLYPKREMLPATHKSRYHHWTSMFMLKHYKHHSANYPTQHLSIRNWKQSRFTTEITFSHCYTLRPLVVSFSVFQQG